jgi:UDP-2,3-diacylglucosamine hydrolase
VIDTAAIRADGHTPTALDGAPPVWKLDPGWQAVDFVSDLHLADDTPRTTATFSAYLQHTTADAVLLLGDIFEVWVGDDCLDEADSFEARCAATLRQVTQRRCVGFMMGNRDFLLGAAACQAIGLRALPDPTLLSAWGQRTLIAHGDAWCLDDIPYQQFRQQVRSPQWRQAFLSRPLAERRAIARQLRAASEAQKQKVGLSAYADLDPAAVDQALQDSDAATLVHGHTHRPASHALPHGRTRHVLSDWHCEPGPAPRRAEVLRWTSTGFTRLHVDEHGRTSPC